MNKLTVFLSLTFICKVAMLGVLGVVAFKTSILWGSLLTASYLGYVAFAALAEREAMRKEQEEFFKLLGEQVKAVGGGTC